MQTHNFESLLTLETKCIELLRDSVKQSSTNDHHSLPLTTLKEHLPSDYDEDLTSCLQKLTFLEVKDENLCATNGQIFSDPGATAACLVVLSLPKTPELSSVEDQIGSLKWFITSMVPLKYHI